jgi:hypothetical protein
MKSLYSDMTVKIIADHTPISSIPATGKFHTAPVFLSLQALEGCVAIFS